MTGAVIITACGMSACNPQDPSAREEADRLKAELAAANRATEEAQAQMAQAQKAMQDMQAKLQDAAGSLEQAVAAKVPTEDELLGKLMQATLVLRKQAEAELPAYTIKGVNYDDVKAPSPDWPFSCNVSMTLVAPNGQTGRLYWKGKGDPMGEWSFEQMDPADIKEAPVVAAADPPVATPPAPTPQPGPGTLPPVAEVTPPKPPPVAPEPRELTPSEKLRQKAREGGAMKADQTRIIDITKMQPLNIR
jgi:hypothetical protein